MCESVAYYLVNSWKKRHYQMSPIKSLVIITTVSLLILYKITALFQTQQMKVDTPVERGKPLGAECNFKTKVYHIFSHIH